MTNLIYFKGSHEGWIINFLKDGIQIISPGCSELEIEEINLNRTKHYGGKNIIALLVLISFLTGCSTWYNEPFSVDVSLDWKYRITDSGFIERTYGSDARGACDGFRKEIIAEYDGSAYELERRLGHEGSVTIPVLLAMRWTRQMYANYTDLPESEKASDREEADKMLKIMLPNDK